MAVTSMLEALLRPDRRIAAGLLSVVGLCWLYLILTAHPAEVASAWSPHYFAAMLLMWIVMMSAMMLPAAAPMVLIFDAISRAQREHERAGASTAVFALGYATVWSGFAGIATAAQYALAEASLLAPTMKMTSATVAGALLMVTGLYQWMPLKQTCLRQCRSPLAFVMAYWRPGLRGSFAMGVRHGAYCLGCCWLLMLLLFVGGVMSLAWIAGLTAFAVIEKTAPFGAWFGRAGGAVLIGWGGIQLWRAWSA